MANKTVTPVKKYLDRETERELIKQYQLTGDSIYVEQLLICHDAYIRKIAARQYKILNHIVEYEDLVQEGRCGLIKAVKKFKLERESVNPNTNTVVVNQALLTYAHSLIVSEMQNLSYHSNATHIPAHTLRAINFNVKNPGSNTEERKKLAKKAMKADSLNLHFNNDHDVDYERQNLADQNDNDPTFDQSIVHLFSLDNQKAIQMLSEVEWLIVQMRLGLVPGEEGIIAKPNVIAEELGLPIVEIEKKYKRAKRILFKHLVNMKENNDG